MKKILNILWSITLIGTSTTSLFACNTPQYSEEKLKEQKEKNKINTANQEIRDNLEWIAPQEKPFNEVDNKWYYVVWRGDEKLDLKIAKFQNKKEQRLIKFDEQNKYYIKIGQYNGGFDISINQYPSSVQTLKPWQKYNKNYFKSVYRWNLDTQEPDLILDDSGNVKVNGE
ncbi:lipoprotein [Spiroplasma endosymbiont of Polydrusus pterygomalis]|uniref:lipoprotein n=1 Tax=Spiroplasma endosymbiont of Polydrusus pterygomalis TaxID=3139327 RepID=UPI003CCABF7F